VVNLTSRLSEATLEITKTKTSLSEEFHGVVFKVVISYRMKSNVDETPTLNGKFYLWFHKHLILCHIESKCFRLSRTKTEYMRCDFGTTTREEEYISLKGQVVPRKDTFRFL
jgi:hypothetical protein